MRANHIQVWAGRASRAALSMLALVAIAMLAAPPSAALLTEFTVDTNAQKDSGGDLPTNCTLGDAIVASNNDAAQDGCTHPNLGTGGPFEIVLAAASGPYLLDFVDNFISGENGLPAIRSTVAIRGNGNTVGRNPGSFFRILHVSAAGDLTLEDLSVVNGSIVRNRGGGISVEGGALTLIDSNILGNSSFENTPGPFFGSGGGIANTGGTVSLTNTIVSGNDVEFAGGGIFNIDGTVSLTNTIVSGNDAFVEGGGIDSIGGTVTLTDSTVSDNAGGGISINGAQMTLIRTTVSGNVVSSSGGGILAGGSILRIVNSTISDNAPEGIRNAASQITLTHSTVFDRIVSNPGSAVRLRNTIVSGGSPACVGGIVSSGNNLASDGTCNLTEAGDLPNTDPMLGPLQDNGGLTATRALLPGSPAIDAADDGICAGPAVAGIDQRGVERPDGDAASGGSCDIGAFEFVGGITVTIDIKPGSDVNPINPFSIGVIPVAILGSDTFDVTDVDVTTLAFGPGGASLQHSDGPHVMDANQDEVDDLLGHFITEQSGVAPGDTEACVTGETLDGTPFEGCDEIRTVPGCGIGVELVLFVPALMWLHGRRRRITG